MNESGGNETLSLVDEKQLEILTNVVPIVVPILFTLIIIIGFVGNLLVVLVVILNKKMRNTTNILIFNLAVSIQNFNPSFKVIFNKLFVKLFVIFFFDLFLENLQRLTLKSLFLYSHTPLTTENFYLIVISGIQANKVRLSLTYKDLVGQYFKI